MSFCILYNVVSENYFPLLYGEEGLASNDLILFELSL